MKMQATKMLLCRFFLAIPLGLLYRSLACGSCKIGGGSTMLKQKNRFLFGIVFTLHYLCQLELSLRARFVINV